METNNKTNVNEYKMVKNPKCQEADQLAILNLKSKDNAL